MLSAEIVPEAVMVSVAACVSKTEQAESESARILNKIMNLYNLRFMNDLQIHFV